MTTAPSTADALADTIQVLAFDIFGTVVALVAAHHDDLAAARACGLRTVYIERPLEFGAQHIKDVTPQPGDDLHCASLLALAQALGC